MAKPMRIQRKRTKGYKMPENCTYVGRPTKWGNPLKLVGDMIYIDASYRRGKFGKWVLWIEGGYTLEHLVHTYSLLTDGVTQFANRDLQYWSDKFKALDFSYLKGKDLSCFCSLSQPCHADILLTLANTL